MLPCINLTVFCPTLDDLEHSRLWECDGICIVMKKPSIPTEYSINTTGDACVGDEVAFEQAIFGGSFRRPKFLGMRLVTGKIVSDSYGVRGQHTFTLELAGGKKMRIKGRNLYRNGLYRKPWLHEGERQEVLAEKHRRGDVARESREWRQQAGI